MPAAPIPIIRPARAAWGPPNGQSVKVLLLSTYDLGHQPFGLASPAAWLKAAGAEVVCNDLAVDELDEAAAREAGLVAFHLPMHTATRLTGRVVPRIRALNGQAHFCFFGLYAPLNSDFIEILGGGTILGGEFEAGLTALYGALAAGEKPPPLPRISTSRQDFLLPDRTGLPPLTRYARLEDGSESVIAGYTEASRGCKHFCRHCPVVPVYGGRFRVVPQGVAAADIAQQVAAGARHISFGDPDFFNGPGHAMRVIEALRDAHPDLTYDVVIKVEHLLKHAALLPFLAETGCRFITTAAESVDDHELARLEKGHTRADLVAALALCRDAGLQLCPTFIPFTPWTTPEGYLELLEFIAEHGLVDHVAPIQLAIRLLIPAGSRLLELDEVTALIEGFDAAALSHRWSNPDPAADTLHAQVLNTVERAEAEGLDRRRTFLELWHIAQTAAGRQLYPLPDLGGDGAPAVARMSEAWFCCAEPATSQFSRV